MLVMKVISDRCSKIKVIENGKEKIVRLV